MRYDVELIPDLTTCTFTGSVRVEVDVVDGGHRDVVMNAAELDVHSATIDDLSLIHI